MIARRGATIANTYPLPGKNRPGIKHELTWPPPQSCALSPFKANLSQDETQHAPCLHLTRLRSCKTRQGDSSVPTSRRGSNDLIHLPPIGVERHLCYIPHFRALKYSSSRQEDPRGPNQRNNQSRNFVLFTHQKMPVLVRSEHKNPT